MDSEYGSLMKRLWLAVCVPVLCAQVLPDRYIVELRGRPSRVQVERAGGRVLATLEAVANAMIVQIPDRHAATLASLPGVVRVHRVRLVKPYLDHAVALHKVNEAWNAIGGPTSAGAGDQDRNHRQRHGAGASRLPGLVDDGAGGISRANQARDLAYTNNKIIVARNYVPLATPQDAFGHGTAVAMAAAGATNTGPLGAITGVAPKAWIGSYKVYQNDNPFGEDTVLQALEDAVNDGMDVINLSLGVALAQRPAEDVLVAAVERAAARGVIVCVAAGNLGSTPNTIASPATAPSAIAVGASSNDRLFAPGLVRCQQHAGLLRDPRLWTHRSSRDGSAGGRRRRLRAFRGGQLGRPDISHRSRQLCVLGQARKCAERRGRGGDRLHEPGQSRPGDDERRHSHAARGFSGCVRRGRAAKTAGGSRHHPVHHEHAGAEAGYRGALFQPRPKRRLRH